MGKWIAFLVVMIVGGSLAYNLFLAAPDMQTANGVAHAYAKAAINNDREKIRSLCAEPGVDSALRTADRLRASSWAVYAFTFTATKPSRKDAGSAMTAVCSGSLLTIEFVHSGSGWKIISAQISEQ